ncbi:MAG: GC-type dockerin domain-anchored protein [Phycisphaerales bacterium]
MTKRLIATVAASLVLAAGTSSALAQFSSDPVNLEFVCDAPGDQVQSKIAVAPNGTFYVAWFDTRTPGYDVYLQRYNADGVEQWEHNGILVADRAVSSTNDWDLDVDAAGNAIVSYGDTSSSVAVSKVTPAGVTLWTTVAGSGGALQPKTAVLSNGDLMVGWTQSGSKLQRISSDGALIGSPITIVETGHYIGLSDVQPGDNGSAIVMWIRASGTNINLSTNKWLYAQKYDTAGARMWNGTAADGAVIVFGPPAGTPMPVGGGTYPNGGAIQAGYQPPFLPDGHGGAVFAFYETSGNRTALVQKIAADGTVAWPLTGLSVATELDGLNKVGAGLAYDPSTGDMFVAWPTSNNAATISGVRAQKITSAGELQWGGNGVEIQASGAVQPSFVQSVANGSGGCYVLSLMGGGTASGKVLGGYVASDGSFPFAPFNVCDLGGNKARMSSAQMLDGSAVFAFSHGATGGNQDLYMGNLRADGTQGVAVPNCAADLGIQGGQPGHDNQLDNNDFIAFISYFFAHDPHADMGIQGGLPGQDGQFDNNDFIAFISAFFNGCS